VVSDGSAVLGLGNIGPKPAMAVMEGKALLFKKFAGLDAVPIVLDTQDVDEIVRVVEVIAPSFGGINLEDISAPRCFEIERMLSIYFLSPGTYKVLKENYKIPLVVFLQLLFVVFFPQLFQV